MRINAQLNVNVSRRAAKETCFAFSAELELQAVKSAGRNFYGERFFLGYGADTLLPWCDVGYAKQARLGIARALEQKIAAGYFSPATAQAVAQAIMLSNGEELFGLSGAA